ncbi:hypothetical protein CRUP_025655, partial [Coryphaenoides rupestris]
WRPGSTGQILSDLDLTSQKEGRWNASTPGPLQRNALLDDDKVFHLGTLQQFVDDFFRSVLCSGAVVPPAIKYFFDFLDEQALKHENVDEETIHIWKTNSLPLRFWVNILKNPHFIFDVHVTEVVDASLHVIAQTFMDACTKTEHKLSRDSPSNKLLYAKEISTYKKMVDDYYKGIRQMVPVSDQDMNTHLAEVSRSHTDKLNTQVALHQLYQYASKYYDGPPPAVLGEHPEEPHFIFDVQVTEMVDSSLSVIAQTFMDACTKSEHKLSRDSPSNKLLYAKEISTYKKMVDDYYKGIRQMVPVSDQDMNTHLAEVSRLSRHFLRSLHFGKLVTVPW